VIYFMTTTPSASPSLLERTYALCLGAVMLSFASALTNALPGAVSELGRWIALGAALLLGLLHRVSQPPPFLLSEQAPGLIAIGLLVFYGASALFSVAPTKSQLYFLVCALQMVLFLFVARRLPAWIWRSLFRWLLILCAAVALLSMAGYLQSNENYVTQGRLSGLSNANTTGLVAMLGCILSVSALLNHTLDITLKARALAATYALILMVSLWVLYLTGSRGSLAGLMAGLGMLIFVRSSRVRASPVFVLALVTLALGSQLIDGLISTESHSVYSRSDDDDILSTRRGVWTEAIELFKESPWFGQGYGVHDAEGLLLSVFLLDCPPNLDFF
jgi:O-antigen ligase